jgi:hypothetical protein
MARLQRAVSLYHSTMLKQIVLQMVSNGVTIQSEAALDAF